MARPAAALAVAALLVLSGCSALFGADPATTTTPQPTTRGETTTAASTPDGPARVLGGSLAVNASRTLRRTGEILGVEDVPQVQVVVREEVPAGEGELSDFYRYVGFERTAGLAATPPVAWTEPGGFRVNVVPGDAPPAAVEVAMARAFVAAYQQRGQGIVPSEAEREVGVGDLPGPAYRTVQEGVALAVADRYAARYLDGRVDPLADAAARVHDAAPGEQLVLAPALVGARYLRWRLGSSGPIAAAYRDPPRSVEQMLHRRPPDVDPPAPLDVDPRGPQWLAFHAGRQGELTLRLALSTALPAETATDAAAGWGNDRLLAFERGNRSGYAWVLRWDDAGEAREFVNATRESLRRRGRHQFGAWYVDGVANRFVFVSPVTVVWLVGDPAFVTAAGAHGSSGNVTVTAR